MTVLIHGNCQNWSQNSGVRLFSPRAAAPAPRSAGTTVGRRSCLRKTPLYLQRLEDPGPRAAVGEAANAGEAESHRCADANLQPQVT